MPLRFLLGIITCFATIAAGLVHPTWYAPIIVQVVCFLLFLHAIKLSMDTPSKVRFPFVAFVFTAIYLLLGMGAFVWTPTDYLVGQLHETLHPSQPSYGKPTLFADWNGWFNLVARYGVSLSAATGIFFATTVLRYRGTSGGDRVVESTDAHSWRS